MIKKENFRQCLSQLNKHEFKINIHNARHPMGYVPLGAITGTTILVLCLQTNHSNSFEDQVTTDFFCGCPIFKWIAVNYQGWQGARLVVPAMAARRHAQLTHWALGDVTVYWLYNFKHIFVISWAFSMKMPSGLKYSTENINHSYHTLVA